MESFHVSFDYSAWWLLPILVACASMAWWLYSGKNNWSKPYRIGLGLLRFFALFLLSLLLLNPKLTSITSYKEKPQFPIVVDNSQSIVLANNKSGPEIKQFVGDLKSKLEKKGFEVPLFTHAQATNDADSVRFDASSSDLSKLLELGAQDRADVKKEHLLFVSDGIFNRGVSPLYEAYQPRIWTLAVGDSTSRTDVALKSLQNNSIAFLGNKFPLKANMQVVGFNGRFVEVVLRDSKGIIDRQKVMVPSNYAQLNVDFLIPATQKGFQRFTVEAVPLEGEHNLLNNKLNAYVDVVDDRENILLVSKAPHPSIKAFRAALAKLQNLHVELLIPGIDQPKAEAYDLIVLHNCLLSEVPEVGSFVKEKTSLFYVVGSEMNFGMFNRENGVVDVQATGQSDQVNAVLNPTFSRFKINEKLTALLPKLPPVQVPFGQLQARQGTEVMLSQRINAVESDKPLLVFGAAKRKTGVLLTDGLWLWRMYEFQETQSTEVFDELIAKSVQYLSSKEDKRKFRAYTLQKEFLEDESPRIETELYNDLYEKVYGQKVLIRMTDRAGKVKVAEFVTSEGNSAFTAASLSPGVYKVVAKTSFGGKEYEAYTEFVVKELNLEALDLKANPQLLRELSSKSQGLFYTWSKKSELVKTLESLEAKPLWKTREQTRSLIDEKWYFFLIVTFLISEWTIRRYTGGY